ncbi:hypothetical protein ACT454_002480 [Enterococcus faecium]|nr:hypothetical protein [Enterococcus faecium]
MEKYDGEFSGLGMILGILIGLAFGRFLFGLMLGIICGIAMDWAANLWNDYHDQQVLSASLRFFRYLCFS